MRKFSEQYARGSGTYFCMDKSVTAVVGRVVKTFHHVHFTTLFLRAGKTRFTRRQPVRST